MNKKALAEFWTVYELFTFLGFEINEIDRVYSDRLPGMLRQINGNILTIANPKFGSKKPIGWLVIGSGQIHGPRMQFEVHRGDVLLHLAGVGMVICTTTVPMHEISEDNLILASKSQGIFLPLYDENQAKLLIESQSEQATMRQRQLLGQCDSMWQQSMVVAKKIFIPRLPHSRKPSKVRAFDGKGPKVSIIDAGKKPGKVAAKKGGKKK